MSQDTVLRMALAVRVQNDPTLSQGEREAYQRILAFPGSFSFAERESITGPLLAWLEGYDTRCAEVVRLALEGDPSPPWRGHRSTEGIVKVAAIVQRLREEQGALPEAQPRRRGKRKVNYPTLKGGEFMTQPRGLDLFCGAGGSSMGYHRAGFDMTGVDIKPQPRYPFVFIQADALEYVAEHGHEYAAIFASPPCRAYSALKHFARGNPPQLIDATRVELRAIGRPWVIENVVGAPLDYCLKLCGTMFGLETSCGAQLRRHRLFESSVMLMSPGACQHGQRPLAVNGHEFRNEQTRWAQRVITVVGDHPRDPRQERRKYRTIMVTGGTPQRNVVYNTIRETFSVAEAQRAMGIDWMGMKGLSQAIPPAYTQWIGQQLLRYL